MIQTESANRKMKRLSAAASGGEESEVDHDPYEKPPTPGEDEPLQGVWLFVALVMMMFLAVLIICSVFGIIRLGGYQFIVVPVAWVLLAVCSTQYSKTKRNRRRTRKAAEKMSLEKHM